MSQIATTTSKKRVSRRVWGAVLGGLLALVVLGLLAPFVDATRFSAPIQRNLEAWLGRDVKFEQVHFTLFSGPGFSLENVTIGEDPRYGLEPFAYVPTLEARLRIDKLLMGRMVFSSLRLVDPFLNLVKRSDGGWNVVSLVERLGAPRRAPLSLFPSFEVENGRIDFKFGTRKTTLYVLDSDLMVYPEQSGKLHVQFSGSPARTDRAGNGFGHLRGTANWYLNAAGASSNRLEANVTLDPSNLSELTTLIQGHDLGVHGTISSRASIEGPLSALKIAGELQLDDIHRWDLLPSSGESWRVRYQGGMDLLAHQLSLQTIPWRPGEMSPVALDLRVNSFSGRPAWSVLARFNDAPIQNLLPLGRRMGLSLPQDLAMAGTLEGAVGYSNEAGLNGQVAIQNATATLPDISPLHAPVVNVSISADHIHLEPANIETHRGTLRAGGDYFFANTRVAASLDVQDFPIDYLKSTVNAWFGQPSALAALNSGSLSGSFSYLRDEMNPAAWSGQFQFTDAVLTPPGLAAPLEHSQGRVSFDGTSFDLSHFSTMLGQQEVRGAYRYNAGAKHPERIHVELASADLQQIEAALAPTFEAQGLLARWRLSRRAIPAWLAARNADGDVTITDFSVGHASLGPLTARFVWQGTNLQFTALRVNLPEGLIRAHGVVNLASYSPLYRFTATVTGFPWRGGLLEARGDFQGLGTGADTLQNLRAQGTFAADEVALSADDEFSKVSGQFDFSFADGWPNLHLSNVEASEGEDAWKGVAASQSDGKLIFDLEYAGRQRRVVSSLVPENEAVSGLLNSPGPVH